MCLAETTTTRRQQQFDLKVRKHLPRNFLVHTIEGGLFIGGMQFLNAQIIGPNMAKSLGAPNLVISLMPILMAIGFTAPQLLMAHRIEQWRRHKPMVTLSGIFQRLPFLAAGLGLLAYPQASWLWLAVAACPLLSGLAGGFTFTAWQELVVKTIPAQRRAGTWAARNILSSCIGLLAGGGIAAVLAAWPGQQGYGMLHLIAFAFLVASFFVFILLREIPYPGPPQAAAISLRENLRQMPLLLRHHQFRWFTLNNVFFAGIYIVIPFLGIHALSVTGREESYLGAFVTVQMLGGIVGNVAAGWLGDRFGGKIVMLISKVGFAAACVWATFAQTTGEFLAIFFLFGGLMFCNQVGGMTLSLEVIPQAKRASYLAVLMVAGTLCMVAAAGICSASHWLLGSLRPELVFASLAGLSALTMVASVLCLLRVREPRAKATR